MGRGGGGQDLGISFFRKRKFKNKGCEGDIGEEKRKEG